MSASGVTKMRSVPGMRRFQFDCLHSPELMQYGPLALYQMGDLSCDSQFALNSHKQVCYEISYIVSGKGWYSADGVRHELQPGNIFICRPGEHHQGGADPEDPFRYFYLGFHFSGSEPDDPFLQIKKLFDSKHTRLCMDRFDVRAPFVHAIKELNHSGPFAQTMIQTFLEQIVVLTYRNFLSDWEFKYPGEGWENTAKRAVYAAIHYIDDRLLSIGDLKEISDAFGYSLSHLSHLFSRETGQSLRSYYAKRKWEKTVELMKEGNYSMTELAAILGYDSIHTFSRAFRKAFGLSPTQYIRSHIKRSDTGTEQTADLLESGAE